MCFLYSFIFTLFSVILLFGWILQIESSNKKKLDDGGYALRFYRHNKLHDDIFFSSICIKYTPIISKWARNILVALKMCNLESFILSYLWNGFIGKYLIFIDLVQTLWAAAIG